MRDKNLVFEQIHSDALMFLSVCTFQQSLKLFELGVYQKSHMMWHYYTDTMKRGLGVTKHANKRYKKLLSKYGDDIAMELISAYNVTELGLMLPYEYITLFQESENGWICINRSEISNGHQPFAFNTEAEARAHKLISLIHDNVISVDTINNAYQVKIDEFKYDTYNDETD